MQNQEHFFTAAGAHENRSALHIRAYAADAAVVSKLLDNLIGDAVFVVFKGHPEAVAGDGLSPTWLHDYVKTRLEYVATWGPSRGLLHDVAGLNEYMTWMQEHHPEALPPVKDSQGPKRSPRPR
jgi:hypothetical protein